MEHRNLLGEPPATYLLPDTEADAAVAAGEAPEKIAARFPAYSAAWASLAERAYAQGDPVTAYAYARTGYHRGLDRLRAGIGEEHLVQIRHVFQQAFRENAGQRRDIELHEIRQIGIQHVFQGFAKPGMVPANRKNAKSA